MTILKRLFGSKRNQPAKRVRVCMECGMPVGEHKDWCAIYREQLARQRPQTAANP